MDAARQGRGSEPLRLGVENRRARHRRRDLAVTFERLRVNIPRIYVLATSPADQIEARRRFDLGEEAVEEEFLKRYAGIVFSDQGRRLLGEFQVINGQWIVGARQVMAAVNEGHRDDAIALLDNKWTDVGARVMVLSREWIDNNQQLANDAGQDAFVGHPGFSNDDARGDCAVGAARHVVGTQA